MVRAGSHAMPSRSPANAATAGERQTPLHGEMTMAAQLPDNETSYPNEAFRQAISEGLGALERKEYAAAREAFQRAGHYKPGSARVAEGVTRGAESGTLARFGKLAAWTLAA